MSAVLTSEDNKRVSGGEVARCEVTVGYWVLMLSLSLDDSRITQGEYLGRTQWSSSLDLTVYLYYFYKWLYTTSPRSHVLLECSTITWPRHVIWLFKFPRYLYPVCIIWLNICSRVFEHMGNLFLLRALITWGSEPLKVSGIWAFDWWGFGADLLLRFSDNCQRALVSWLLMGLRSATGRVWNAGVGTGIEASIQSGSLLIWGMVAGSILWNSEGSSGGGDERGRTEVRGVPDWRRLDLLGRPEVKWPIVRSARGMELLPEEGAADWWDIRIKTWQEPVWVCKFCQGRMDGVWRNRVIIELYSGMMY